MRKYLLYFLFTLPSVILFSQKCDIDQNMLIIKITTDKFGRETSWVLSSADSVYGGVAKNIYNGVLLDIDTFCIAKSECLSFTIYDGFGDGIMDGGYEIFLNDSLLAAKSEFGLSETIEINCPAGTSCSKALLVEEGDYIAPLSNYWYVFNPDSVGTYEIATCDDNDCDTQIWVYDRCESVRPGDREGFIFFNDDGCGVQAKVNAFLDAGRSYLIRISDKDKACGNQAINWSLTYKGPIIGCTDPTACNYNPLATQSDGSCLKRGDINCPSGPDLKVREDILRASIQVATINNEDDCLVKEGCLKGYGQREIIRFTTRFENIGEQDYYIGAPSLDNNQFTYDNCHNHFHYDNYAEYLLFDKNGAKLPAGFKRGFCVVDLVCTTGNNKYGCNNMGLTVGCSDEYNSDLDCQWIDVTDYPDGNYTFVARVNWGNQPDLIGRVEQNLTNNWSQACLVLDRSSGKLVAKVETDCPIVVDCQGTPYGNVQQDCNGVCGGLALIGDTDSNTQQDMQDVQQYISLILDGETAATPCNDLKTDGTLTVYDAALLADCLNFGKVHQHPLQGIHNHCDFPAGILNILDTVRIKIIEFDASNQTIDLAIQNTTADVVAYQLQLSGISILSVENLLNTDTFPVQLKNSIHQAVIIGLSLQGKHIGKSRDYQPFLRIHYLTITESVVCIDRIMDIVNSDYQQVTTTIEGDCINTMLVDAKQVINNQQVKVQPNPFNMASLLTFPNPAQEVFTLRIFDTAGHIHKYYTGITGNRFEVNRNGLADGLYFFQLQSERYLMTGKMILE